MHSLDQVLNAISNIIAITALLPLGLFIYYYGTIPIPGHTHLRRFSTRRWASTSIGRVLMYQKIAWFSYLVFVVFSLLLGNFLFREEIRLIIYIALVVLFWSVFFVMRKLQKSTDTATAASEAVEDAVARRAEADLRTGEIAAVEAKNPETPRS